MADIWTDNQDKWNQETPMIRIAIVEDEAADQKKLQNFVQQYLSERGTNCQDFSIFRRNRIFV